MKRGQDLAIGLGQRLQKLREDRELSQRQLAQIAGCDPMQIHRYERGAGLPTADTLAALATALGISADALLFDRGGTPQPPQIRNAALLTALARLDALDESDVQLVLHLIESVVKRREYELAASEGSEGDSPVMRGIRAAISEKKSAKAKRSAAASSLASVRPHRDPKQ